MVRNTYISKQCLRVYTDLNSCLSSLVDLSVDEYNYEHNPSRWPYFHADHILRAGPQKQTAPLVRGEREGYLWLCHSETNIHQATVCSVWFHVNPYYIRYLGDNKMGGRSGGEMVLNLVFQYNVSSPGRFAPLGVFATPLWLMGWVRMEWIGDVHEYVPHGAHDIMSQSRRD